MQRSGESLARQPHNSRSNGHSWENQTPASAASSNIPSTNIRLLEHPDFVCLSVCHCLYIFLYTRLSYSAVQVTLDNAVVVVVPSLVSITEESLKVTN